MFNENQNYCQFNENLFVNDEKLDKFPYDKAVKMLDTKHLYDLDNKFVDTIMGLMNQL